MANAISVIECITSNNIVNLDLSTKKVKNLVQKWNFWFDNDSEIYLKMKVSYDKIIADLRMNTLFNNKSLECFQTSRGTHEYTDLLKVCRSFSAP